MPAAVHELAALTAGADMWTTAGTAGERSIRLSDGPNGVRGPRWDERDPAICTPCGTALAASWDVAVVDRVGRLVAAEAHRQDVQVVLGPTLNIHRSPLGGRGFECFSEDPLLSGQVARAWVEGVQSLGIGACPKHLVANDSETSRTRVNCVVDEQALREIYLAPFEQALRAGAWAVMAAYNKVNGQHVTEHHVLLWDIVKDEWQWDGVVVSDWLAAHDTVACALAGLDLEMPGPPEVYGDRLAEAVIAGRVPIAVLHDKADRLRRLVGRVTPGPERELAQRVQAAEEAQTAEATLVEAAAAGFVLLKNDRGDLPLDPRVTPRSVALIGPNAEQPCLQGGGSAEVALRPTPSISTCLTERMAPTTVVRTEAGCANPAAPCLLHALDVRVGPEEDAPTGMVLTYFAEGSEEPAHIEHRHTSRPSWFEGMPGLLPAQAGRVVMTTWLRPAAEGYHAFTVRGSGDTVVRVDGAEVTALPSQSREGDPLAAWFSDEMGEGEVLLTPGDPVLVQVEMFHEASHGARTFVEYGCRPPVSDKQVERAVTLAAGSDLVVLVLGTGSLWDTESKDRVSMGLPGDQDRLARAVLAVHPQAVVVLNSGTAMHLPWLDQAETVLQAWLPGDGFAEALAAVLVGDLEPGGRLPVTFAADPLDHVAYDTRPDRDGVLNYRESVFVGYRHFDAARVAPAFAFGHGLGYTTIEHVSMSLSVEQFTGHEVVVQVRVCNTGRRSGKAVVQIYVEPPPGLGRPVRELKGFARATVEPGQECEVSVSLDRRSFARWDTDAAGWVVDAGTYVVHAGRSSRDLTHSASVIAPHAQPL